MSAESRERAEWLAAPNAPVLRTSIGELLRSQARLRSDGLALLWIENSELRCLSYAELLAVAERCAHWILQRSRPGDVTAIWGRNCIDWVIAEYGCALSGTILASFNSAWTDYELEHAVALTTPRLILAGTDSRGASLGERAVRHGGRAEVESLNGLINRLPSNNGGLPTVAHEAPFLIQFTSGTTGRAKGALLSHAGALNAGMLRAEMQMARSDDVFLNGSPLHHVAGSVSLVLGSLVAGAAYVLVDRVTPAGMIDLVRRSGATRLGGVPTVLMDILEHADFPDDGFKLVSVGVGGAEVPESLVHRISSAFHATVSVGYGQSECPLVANSRADDPPEIIASTVGVIPPQNDLRIVDPLTGNVLEFGEVGEVWVRSPASMLGYFRNPAATAEVLLAGGWLRTGDLGSLSADGYLTLCGRAREVIMRGGVNIYPAEIENVLIQHPSVLSAAAIGVGDKRLGELVAAVVVLRKGTVAAQEELEAFARKRIAHYKVPQLWRYVQQLPMTASGKVRKLDLIPLFTDADD